MKLLAAIVVYLGIGAALGWGILHAANGKPLLLIVGVGAYLLGLGILGCLPPKEA